LREQRCRSRWLAKNAANYILSAGRVNGRNCFNMKLINIGFGNIVSAGRIVAIVSPESAPIKRIISDAREKSMLIDATFGRRTRAVIVIDNGFLLLSALQPETVAARLQSSDKQADSEHEVKIQNERK